MPVYPKSVLTYFDFYKIKVLRQKWKESECCFLAKSCFCVCDVDPFSKKTVALVTWILKKPWIL